MEAKVISGASLHEFFTDEQCYIAEIYNDAGDRSHSLAHCRVDPRTTTCWHLLKSTSEIYYILQGTAVVEVGDSVKQEVGVGDSICIPADTPQRITNTGNIDLLFLCICRPAFDPSCYLDLEER